MNRLVCNVRKCNNNSFGMCHMNKIVVEEKCDLRKMEHKCSSFEKANIFKKRNTRTLNGYLEKLEEIFDDTKTPDIRCSAVECIYNNNRLCMSDNVIIYGFNANKEEYTNCKSFTTVLR